jgi:translocation and assembly module TamA
LQLAGEASSDPEFLRWREEFPLQLGDVLLHSAYEDGKRKLLDLAHDRGYFEARLLEHVLEVTVAQNSVRVALHLDSGPRYLFGKINFSAVALNKDLLHSYMKFKPGEPYDTELLFELQRALADSDYFEFIEVHAGEETAANGLVPIEVKLRLRPPTRYTFGIGYGTDTGPRIGIGLERRRVNMAGHRLNIESSLSEIQKRLRGVYRIPLLRHPNADFISFSGGWEEENLDTSYRETLTAGAGFTMLLGRWQRTYALTWQKERFHVADQRNSTTMVLPSWSLQRIEADDRMFPHKGWRLGLELRGASEALGSDVSLLQGLVRAKAVYPLLGGRFITRADFGASKTPDFERIPASLRFFAGGDNSVRGYGYKTLGPVNAEGKVVGGRNLLVASGEYEYYFGPMFGAAVFYDAGNAFNSSEYNLKHGAGTGLRWRLPFGVVRLDVARPIKEHKFNWRLHITIGPDL